MTLDKDPNSYQWALPEGLEVPPDELKARLDLYRDTVVLYILDDGIITTRIVSARDITMAFLHEVPLTSGLLPADTLWWGQGKEGVEVSLWRSARVWPVALVTEPLKPPKRLRIPMPGLIFVCSPGRAPRVYAAKKRPKFPEEIIYHAPLFNVFRDGRTCAGTHRFPDQVEEMPESFFTSFFSPEGEINGRSHKYPNNLYRVWWEIDGKKRYPLKDLVPIGKVEDIMK